MTGAVERVRADDGDPVWRVRGDPLLAGSATGALRGLTVAVKDTYAVAGHAVGAGNPTWLAEARVEPRCAPALQALLHAGADVLGIARTVELAYGLTGANAHHGTPPNPAASGRVPGGSSSGPASAVASGAADIGLGSDTAGSIRVPASYCGLLGLRVTHGAVSTEGLLPLAPGFDAVGWLTRDARTLASVTSVLLPEHEVTGLTRVAVAADLFELAAPSVRSALADVLDRVISRLGLPSHRVRVLDGRDVDDWVEAFVTVQAAEAWEAHGAWAVAHPWALGPATARRLERGRAVTASQLRAASTVLAGARQAVTDAVPPGTVLLQPATSTAAPPVAMSAAEEETVRTTTLGLTCPASIAGLPVVTLRAAEISGLPVGLCMVGARHSDRRLASLATHLEGLGVGR